MTTPSLNWHHSDAFKWCGKFNAFINPDNLSSLQTGNNALLKYYGVSRYSKFLTKNSVGFIQSELVCFPLFDIITISSTWNIDADLAIW